MNKKILNSLKIAFSLIGAVIGAGFITGREIIRFFYGNSPLFAWIVLCVIFFFVFYISLKTHGERVENFIVKSNKFVCIFNVVIMASMLGAIDSLFNDIFNLGNNFAIFSILLLLSSTFICLNKIDWINKINLIIVPFIIIVLLIITVILPKNINPNIISKQKFSNFFGYACLNCFLAQPFITNLKGEKTDFSPLLSSLIASLILSSCASLYLRVLTPESTVCDIPILCLLKGDIVGSVIAVVVMFFAIISTQISAQYPIINGFFNKKGISAWWVIFVNILTFAISRIGFYKIVDLIYPAIAVLAICYYCFISILTKAFPKVVRKRTS